MTVNLSLVIIAVWAFGMSLFLNWYWSRKLVEANHERETLKRIIESNNRTAARAQAEFIAGIVNRIQPTALPKLDSKKWRAIVDLYNLPEMAFNYRCPAQITTDHDERPTVFWKITDVNELTSYEIARLWIVGVL